VSAAPVNESDLDRASDEINAPEDGMPNNNISTAKKQPAYFTESKLYFL
jgi:hypothetical protein